MKLVCMDKLLELAIDKLKESSEEEQNRIAQIILKEIQPESQLSPRVLLGKYSAKELNKVWISTRE